MNRRELLKGFAAASVVAAAGQHAWASDQSQSEKMVEYLFVQNAQG
ncbi:MAG: twin-arginine translocation signal domain-containing protein [Desulfobacterales bacterium]